MAEQSPAFQFYPRDFLASATVSAMTAEQVGIYTRLLCYAWLDGSIPADEASLAALARVSVAQMRKSWPSVGRCFIAANGLPGRLVNPRMEEERAKQQEYRESSSSRGKAAARARWGKQSTSNAHAYADADAQAMLGGNSSSASSSSSSSASKSPPSPPAERGGSSDAAPVVGKPPRRSVFARAVAQGARP